MIQQKFLCILPKLESYEFKDGVTKSQMREKIYNMVSELYELTFIPYMIAEDELAYDLFKNTSYIKWISVLPKMDSIYIASTTDIYEGYLSNSYNKYRSDIISEVAKNIKYPPKDEKVSLDMYVSNVVNAISRRIRSAARMYQNEFPIILYFSKGVGFTKKYEPKVGDKKIYIEVDLDTDITNYYYSGISISKDDLFKILRGIT